MLRIFENYFADFTFYKIEINSALTRNYTVPVYIAVLEPIAAAELAPGTVQR